MRPTKTRCIDLSAELVRRGKMIKENRSVEAGRDVDRSVIIPGNSNTATITNYYYYYREDTQVVSVEPTGTTDENLPCPYRGLFHFSPNDADIFFGREVFVEELFAATKKRNFIPVLGASGSGKSSVVLAGLVPRLQKEGNWLFTHFRPGSDPFYALAESLVPLYTSGDPTVQIAQARALAKYFHDDKITLPDIFSHIQRQHPHHRVLLIADQFEELYTLCADQKIRRSFLDTLLACFQSSPSQYNNVLITTMRADFLGNALSYPKFGDLLQNADIKIRSMNHEELTQVIAKPAEKLGVSFEGGLVERILNDVEDEPGNLPLLEFALTQLWKERKGKQLTHAAYEKIGEVKGALARHADENYRKLSETEQEQVRRIFIQLVRPGEGTEDTRRLAMKAELSQTSWALVKQLADARLVVTSRNSANQETVEVVHEALISNWGELREWMDTDRNFRIWQDRLRLQIYQWEHTQWDNGALLRGVALGEAEEKLKQRQDDFSKSEQEFILASIALRDSEDQQRSSRKRLIFSGLAGGLVLALGLSGLAVIGWMNAEISQIKNFAQNSDVLLNSDGPKAVQSSVKAAVKMRGKFWVDANTRTQVELALLKTVHKVAVPNSLGEHADSVLSVSYSPDGNILASASADNTVKLWDTHTDKVIKTFNGHTSSVWDVNFSPDGNILASASADKTVKLWDIHTGKVIKTFTGHTGSVWAVTFSPDGKMLASASRDNTVKLWDTNTGEPIETFTGHNSSIYYICFSPDGKILASASADDTVKLWNTSTRQLIKTLTGHKDDVRGVSFSPDGEILASASADKTVKLWDTTTGKLVKTLTGHRRSILSVSYSPDGNILASASHDNRVKLWDTTTNKEIKTRIRHINSVYDISFSPDSEILASASRDNTVKLWDVSTGKQIKILNNKHRADVSSVRFSLDGKMLASASRDNTVKLWDTHTGTVIKTLTGHTNWVYDTSFSPNGKILASASRDNTVKLWDTTTGTLIKTLTGHTNWVLGVSFSSDGKMLASASKDYNVKLWNTTTGKHIKTLTGHTNSVYSTSFSRDGKILASAGGDKTVKLWDTTTGKVIKILTEHKNSVRSVSFSPDGKMLASASNDNTVRLWRRDFNYLLQEGCNFLRKYYETNPPDNESDRRLCDGIGNS